MHETFPHHYEDGYVVTDLETTGWPAITYSGLYRDTIVYPYQWNDRMKKKKPVAQFVQGVWRGKRVENKKCWFVCELTYKYSAN